jgi:GNAT superfamily N-acetyltransferase
MGNDAFADKTEIREIPLEMFALSCSGSKLASYYAVNLGSAGKYLAAFSEGAMAGYAICRLKDNGALDICLLFVEEERRRRGIGTRLLEKAENSCRAWGEHTVKFCLSGESDDFIFMKAFLEKRGYVLGDRLFIFWCDGYGDPGYIGWERYMERRGERLLRWLEEEEGFGVTSLEEADKSIEPALRMLKTHGNSLDILDLLDGRRGPLSRRISCVTTKNGCPVAFCLVNVPDERSVVFEQIGVIPEYQNTGAILPAISASIRLCKKFGYQRILYSIYESNAPALSFAKRVLSNVTSTTKIQFNYFKKTGALLDGR